MSEETLKACPFCGGEAEIEQTGTNRRSCIVSCLDCGARNEGPDEYENSGKAWNTRQSPESKKIEEVLEEIKEIKNMAILEDDIEHGTAYFKASEIVTFMDKLKSILEVGE